MKVRPFRSGISGSWSWTTPEGGAMLYTGGKTPSGGNTKVLWRGRPLGGTLVGAGSRLDGQNTFRQEFRGAGGPTAADYWSSIVNVPEPGCWLLTVRIVGQSVAGIVVARVVAA